MSAPSSSEADQRTLDQAEAVWFEWREAHKDWPPFEIFREAYKLGFAASATPANEYICKCGVRVVPHRCQTGKEF